MTSCARAVITATLSLSTPLLTAQDWADAPDPPYRSRQASGGAVHQDTNFEWLGASVTDEPDAHPNNTDADDGVHLRGPYVRGTTAGLRYVVSVANAGSGRYGAEPARQIWVHGFADWNGDGDFDDAGEALFTQGHDASQFPSGRNQQAFDASFAVPDQPIASVVWFRVRLDYGENLSSPYGSALFGEVEDWRTSTLFVPDQHPTVQAAVDAADPGDAIVIRPGTYVESVTIRKEGIALVGTPGATILRGSGTGSGVAVVHYQAQSGRVVGLVLTGGQWGLLLQRPAAASEERSYQFDIWKTEFRGNTVAGEIDVDGDVELDDDDILGSLELGVRIRSAGDVHVKRTRTVGNNTFGFLANLRGNLTFEDCFTSDHTQANVRVDGLVEFKWLRGELSDAGVGLELRTFAKGEVLQATFIDHKVSSILLPQSNLGARLLVREASSRSRNAYFIEAEQRVSIEIATESCRIEDAERMVKIGAGVTVGRVFDQDSQVLSVTLGIEADVGERDLHVDLRGTAFQQTRGLLSLNFAFSEPGSQPIVELHDVRATGVTDDAIVARNLGTGTFTMLGCDIRGTDANKTGVLVENCANVTIDGCTVDRFKAGGIALKTCTGTVARTTVTHNGTGMSLDACTSLAVGDGNDVEANDVDGIATTGGCQGVSVTGSTISANRANGLRLGPGSGITIRGNEIIGNGAHGVYDTGVGNLAVQSNKICCNSLAGVAIATPVSASITGNILQANGTFEVDNRSPASIDATNNDWGPATTVQMRSGEPNITRIFDCYDASSSGCVSYRPWSDPTNTCEPECFLLLGAIPVQWPIPFSPLDTILVQPVWLTGVTMTTMPTFALPPEIGLRGLHVYFQVYLHNERAYPLDPVKTSNGIDVELDVASTSYGTATGMTLWAEGPPRLGGTLVLRFRIGQ